MKKLVILFSAMMFAAACGNNPGAETNVSDADKVETLKKEVMEVHDRTMAQMGKLSKLEKELQTKLEQEGGDSLMYMGVISELRKSNEGMMNWMRNFESPDEMQASEAEKAHYLEKQKQEVISLEESTASSITRAETLLQGK